MSNLVDWKKVKQLREQAAEKTSQEKAAVDSGYKKAMQERMRRQYVEALHNTYKPSAAEIQNNMADRLALSGLSLTPDRNEMQHKITQLQQGKAGAARRGKDTTIYDMAADKLMDYVKSGAVNVNTSVEELQKRIDKPVVTMDDLDLDDEATVSRYLGHDADAVQFFKDWRSGKAWRDEANQARYTNLLNTIEAKVNNQNDAESRYTRGTKVAYTDATGRKYNFADLMKGKVAQNRMDDIDASRDSAGQMLSELATAGGRDITREASVSGADLQKAGWNVSGDSVNNFTQAYSNDLHKTAAVFSPVVLNEDGGVERILSPEELQSYADGVLAGGGDKLGLKITDTYSGMYAASLADENSKRIRRLSERYFNDTDFNSLLDSASYSDVDARGETVYTRDRDKARSLLSEYGIDYDEYKTYADLMEDKERNAQRTAEYAKWSTENGGNAALATAANIVTSPVQAFEYIKNLGENLSGWFKAGTNEFSAHLLPNTYNDVVTNLSEGSTGAITEKIRSDVRGNGDNDFLNAVADVAANTYGGVTSSIQSALTVATCYALLPAPLAEGVSLGVMSGEAANGAYHDVINNGGTVGQAVTYSVAAGVNEYLGEKLSIENLFSLKEAIGKQGAKEVLKGVLWQGVTEGSEEAVTEGLNEFADRLINGDKSQYERSVQQYLDAGYSEEEAKRRASTDFIARVGWSAYGGAIGGLFAGGGKVAMNTMSYNNYANRAGSAVQNAGNTEELLSAARQMDEGSIGYDEIQKRADKLDAAMKKNGATSKKAAKRTGQLYATMQDYNARNIENAKLNEKEKVIAELYAKQINNDGTDPTVPKMSKLINRYINGEKLTENEQKIIANPAAQRTISAFHENYADIEERINKEQKRAVKSFTDTAKLTQPKESIAESDEDVNISEFNISEDDGKTYTADGTEQVDIKRIASVGDNDITVELSNGKTESVKALSLGSESSAILYQSVLDMQKDLGAPIGADLANSVIDGYNAIESEEKPEATQYVREVEKAVQNGYINSSATYTGNVLSENEYKAYYEQGRSLAVSHTEAQRNAVRSRATLTDTHKAGKVTFADDVDYKKLDGRRRAGVDAVSKMAESLGFDVVFYRSTKDGKGRFNSKFVTDNGFIENGAQAPNGFWKNGTMYLDVNSGSNGQGLILFTASHELVHMIREGAPEHFKALADFLVQNYAEKGADIRKLVRAEMLRSTNLNYDEAYEEVIAQSCESFLRDVHLNEKSKALYKQNPTLWQSIKNALSRIIDSVKRWYSVAKPESEESRLAAKLGIEALEEAQDRFVEGIVAAAENLRKTEKAADEGGEISTGIMFDNRIEDYPYNMQTVISDYINGVDDSLLNWVDKVENGDHTFKRETIADVGKREISDIESIIGVDVTGYRHTLTTSGIEHIIDRHGKNGSKDMSMSDNNDIARIKYVIENYDAVERLLDQNGDPVFSHAFMNADNTQAPMIRYSKKINGTYYVVESVPDGQYKRLWIQSAYIQKNTVTQASDDISPDTTSETDLASPVFGIIIPDSSTKGNTSTQNNQSSYDFDYLSAVDRGDMQTAQRMVDEAAERAFANSKIRGEDGKLIKVYHGTDADFTVFDKSKGRPDMDIQGMFFSPDEDDAGGYGSVGAYYLNIQNPADFSTGYKALNSHKGENYAGIKAREDLERMGYDGVNNSDEEYIAFNSEQIKLADPVTYDDNGKVIPLSRRFDSSNKDIRYMDRYDFGIELLDDDDLFGDDDLYGDDDSIENIFAKEYASHHEDIGEVLRNISDIELTPSAVNTIVNRVIRESMIDLDPDTRRTLSIELQLALEKVNTSDPETVMNEMVAAVRKAIDRGTTLDDEMDEAYRELVGYLSANEFYLTDRQIADLREHDMTLKDFKNKMFGYKISIISRDTALKRAGHPNAGKLSLEGLHDAMTYPDAYLPFKHEEWDYYGDQAPMIIMETLEKLRKGRFVRSSEILGDYIDDYAVDLTAKITGGIVEAKYNSRKNPYVSKLVSDLKKKRTEAVQKQKEANKQKLTELRAKERERAEKREAELKEKYREQRSRNSENRKRTELRGKIRRLADDFQKRLTAPRGAHYVPRELIAQTIDVLNAIDLDTGRSTNLSEKIAALRTEYDKMQKDEQAYAMYDDVISSMLSNLYDELKGASIMDMNLSQLKSAYDVLRSMHKVVTDAVKLVDTDFKKTAHQAGREMIAETRAVPKAQSGVAVGWLQTQLRADVMFNRLAGFKKDSTWSQMAKMLNDGQLKMTRLKMEFSMLFDDLVKDTQQLKRLFSTKESDLVDLGLVDDEGESVKITRGMMLSLYMHLQNEDNARHVLGGGLTVPDMKAYYKGDMGTAFGKGVRSVRAGSVDFTKYTEGLKSRIEEEMSDYEKLWVATAHEFYDGASRNELNDTTMKLYGYKRANVVNYFPIRTDPNYRAAQFESIVRDMSLENSGFMKERVKASNPILLEDLTDVINVSIDNTAKYCGLTIPIKNFQKVYGTTMAGFETSLQREINKKFSGKGKVGGATKYIENLITDLTSGRKGGDDFLSKAFAKARGNLAQATLTLNPRVAIAQAASYPTAAAEIGWKPLLKALKMGVKAADRAEIAEITPLLWLRSQGYSNTEIGDMKELRKQKHAVQGKVKKALGWIEFFDTATVGRLYYASKFYVEDNYKDLKPGTEEYKLKVAEVYNNVIEKTQPNYSVMQRPDILRNPSTLVKSFTMFMTQRLQNFNILYDAVGTYNKYLSDYKAGVNGVTHEDVRFARTKLRRAIASQLTAAVTIVGMKFIADIALHSVSGYRDDDDELTLQSVCLGLLNNFADTIFGNVLFFSDIYKALMSAAKGERYYGIGLSGVDSLSDMIIDFVNLSKNVVQSAKGEKELKPEYFHELGKSICQFLGIPLNNAEKIGKGIYNHVSDFAEGDGFSFEAGVERSNKQNVHRIELAYSTGDEARANAILSAMIEEKKSQGKTEKEARTQIRTSFTNAYKKRYVEAVKRNDKDEVKNIRQLLYFTRLYGDLADQDKTMQKWIESSEE